jgi:hypothetical protein
MNRSSQAHTTSDKRKRWARILGFLTILILILLEPQFEKWLAGRDQRLNPQGGAVSDNSQKDNDPQFTSPGPLVPSSSTDSEEGREKRPASGTDDRPGENSPSSAQIIDDNEGSSTIRMHSTPAPGKLTEIRRDVFQSSAGLIYRAGSEDGHRLKHIMQHAKDNPQKKIHGVFDGGGDRDIILAVIDEAWLRAQMGGSDVRSEQQNERRVYTINLRRRIGAMGGEEGKRRSYPECRYLRIVLENGNEVISAYPTRSF